MKQLKRLKKRKAPGEKGIEKGSLEINAERDRRDIFKTIKQNKKRKE